MYMFLSALQLRKQILPIDFNDDKEEEEDEEENDIDDDDDDEDSNSTDNNLVQHQNAPNLISMTDDGIIIFFNDKQFPKAPSPITCKLQQ